MQVKVHLKLHLLGKALLRFRSIGACPVGGCVVPHQGDRRPGYDNDGNSDDNVDVDDQIANTYAGPMDQAYSMSVIWQPW